MKIRSLHRLESRFSEEMARRWQFEPWTGLRELTWPQFGLQVFSSLSGNSREVDYEREVRTELERIHVGRLGVGLGEREQQQAVWRVLFELPQW